MGSFDVKSLFINIPFRETIDLCVENLYRNQTHIYSLTKSSSRRFFICYIEKIICLENSPNQFKPVVYRRCVDDIFLLSNFLHLNKQHKNVVFTYGNEKKKMVHCHFQTLKSAIRTTNLSLQFTKSLQLVELLQVLKVLFLSLINMVKTLIRKGVTESFWRIYEQD